MHQIAPVVPPHRRAIEGGDKPRVFAVEQESLVVQEVTSTVQAVGRMKLNLLVDELGPLEEIEVVDSVLDFVPLVASRLAAWPIFALEIPRARFEGCAVLLQVRQNRWVLLYFDSSSSKYHPQSRPFGRPARDVLTAEVLLQDLGRSGILSAKPLPRR